MSQPSDIQIVSAAKMKRVDEVAASLGIDADYIESYGRYKAKLDSAAIIAKSKKKGKLVLVTAISPTPAGEGKTTTTIGLADGLNRIGKNVVAALREPSLGPVFGVKGGAAGGGYAQVVPMEDINLHFTGDLHAVTSANNLLAAMLDNHLQHGNVLGIDPRTITWRRCLDMNDRQLRRVVSGLGGKTEGIPREDGFSITAASEVMACLCLADSLEDLKARLGRIVLGYNMSGEPVTAGQLKAQGAMAVLLKEAVKPNLVQTLENTPVLIHGGPFANIAHGCNSVIATKTALALGDYVVTEAGFGADLGAEKFFDIKCRLAGLEPTACVLVATIRALKHHGGVAKDALSVPNPQAVEAGMPNLTRHLSNITSVFGMPCVVAINRFDSDSDEELEVVRRGCAAAGAEAVLCEAWGKGGEGALELAAKVAELCELSVKPSFAYDLEMPLFGKIEAIVKSVYRGASLELASGVQKQLKALERFGFGGLPVCVAKTQYSFSDNQKRLCAPEGFSVTVREVRVSAGAGFVVALTGEIMTMPGLSKVPAAEGIDIDAGGNISGLF